MKKVLSYLLATVMMVTLLTGCGSSTTTEQPATSGEAATTGEKPSYTFKYAELNPAGHIMTESGEQFAKLVEEKSEGRIKIEVFPAGQLGDEKTMYQTLQMGGGAIDIARGNTNSLVDFGAKKVILFGLPFIFRDREHLWNVLHSEIGDEFLKEPQEINSGMVGLFYLDEGARHVFTTQKHPIDSIDSFKGLKLRVPTTDLMTETMAALGVQSTPISFSELYSALQTGTVDGAEQPYSGYFSNKFYEVAPNYTLTGHTYSPSIVLMSDSVWKKLSEEDQKIIMDAAKETEQWNLENIERLDAELLEQIKAAGANVIEVPDKTPYIEATKSVVDKYSAGYEDLVQQIRDK